MTNNNYETKGVYVAIVGEPNVGKSTLLNKLLGRKLSITSRKRQTTRHRLLGIKTDAENQYVFVDTPGLHSDQPKLLNRYMNRMSLGTFVGVDVILWLRTKLKWSEYDDFILEHARRSATPVIVVQNKVDKLDSPDVLLPCIEGLKAKYDFAAIVPLSAKTGENIDALWGVINNFLNPQPFYFNEDQITDRSDSFVASEWIREQLTRKLGQELPYDLSVSIDMFQKSKKLYKIYATIWVDRDSQKAIVIGHDGDVLKTIGTRSRLALEEYFQNKVFLQLWVKVKRGWADRAASLNSLGYDKE
jgi:GTP-binding protein Era